MTMTKTEKRVNTLQTAHGERLKKIFPAAAKYSGYALYSTVRALEIEAHKLAEDQCNRPLSSEYITRVEDRIERKLDDILGYRAAGVSIFLNGDPRGYALKIHDSYVREHKLDIHTDWGGYGIIAPDFEEE